LQYVRDFGARMGRDVNLFLRSERHTPMSEAVDFWDWKEQRARETFPLIVDDRFIEMCRVEREAHRLANARQLWLPFDPEDELGWNY
jgi:hypothetical protein